jgi:hypothetical protein
MSTTILSHIFVLGEICKIQTMRNILYTMTILLLITSCKKEKTENLKQVTISGFVFDSSNRVGMSNVLVRIYWYSPGLQETIIDSARTDAQGNYLIKTTIDILRFNNQSLEVAAIVPNGFISIYDLGHPTVGASTVGYTEAMHMLPFIMYEKANLTINLQRTFNDAFTDFQLYYNYGGRDYWVNLDNNRPTGVITYNVVTAVGVKTKVHWTKKLSSNTTTTFQDSISVLPNAANSLTVTY